METVSNSAELFMPTLELFYYIPSDTASHPIWL